MRSARSGARRCTSRIGRCSGTCGTRADITTGIASSRGRRSSTSSAQSSETSAPTTPHRSPAYYDRGAPADWQERFVSAYASSHPWEDWAETWAHYLHMVDTLETAAACGLSLKPRRRDEPALPKAPDPVSPQPVPFRAPDRQLVSADLRVEQPESRARARGRVPVRPLGPGGRQAAIRGRRRRAGARRHFKSQGSSLKAQGLRLKAQ